MLRFYVFHGRSDWLQHRRGIGGSDAAAVLGQDPHRSNVDLWRELTRRVRRKDISELPYVKYGTEAEQYVRQLFALDHPDMKVDYQPDNIWVNTDMPFAHASLDGWLTDKDGRKGVLEIKTGQVFSRITRSRWDGQIPAQYYCQVLFYLMVTGWDYVWLRAYLRTRDHTWEMRDYNIDRTDDGVEDDISALRSACEELWNYVVADKEPPLKLQGI